MADHDLKLFPPKSLQEQVVSAGAETMTRQQCNDHLRLTHFFRALTQLTPYLS